MANALDEEKKEWNNKVFKGMMNREKNLKEINDKSNYKPKYLSYFLLDRYILERRTNLFKYKFLQIKLKTREDFATLTLTLRQSYSQPSKTIFYTSNLSSWMNERMWTGKSTPIEQIY